MPPGLAVLVEETSSVQSAEKDPVLAAPDVADLWSAVLAKVKSQVNPQSYSTWFEPTRLSGVVEGELLVEGPNQFFVDWLAEHHLDKLEEAAASILGKRPRIVLQITDGGLVGERIVRTPERASRPASRSPERAVEAGGLNLRYSL